MFVKRFLAYFKTFCIFLYIFHIYKCWSHDCVGKVLLQYTQSAFVGAGRTTTSV